MNEQILKPNIGEVFSERRSEMNLSLKEVENATSIRIAYLQAIEEGRIGQVISPVYARGFVKQYAHFLNLDGDVLLRDNPQVFAQPVKQEFSYGIGTLEYRSTPGGGVKGIPNFLWVIGVLGLLGGGWYLARFLGLF